MTSVGLTPLTELGATQYQGHEGGLYAQGSNDVPADHLELGLRMANLVGPLDEQGVPDPDGLVGLVSIGVSNTKREFGRFMELADSDAQVSPNLVLVNGAQGGQGLEEWSAGAGANPWFDLAVSVDASGLTAEQVQAAWIKVPDGNRGTPDLNRASAEVDRLAEVVRIAKSQYPNLRLAYVSSRIYGGYGGLHSEPAAYQNGFTVKMLIERQISGDPDLNSDAEMGPVSAPWLAWGPYLWADGVVPRSDGLTWECNDFDADGIHPNVRAADKVAALLMQHFSLHETSTGWFHLTSASSSPTTIFEQAGTPNSTLPARRGAANDRTPRQERVAPEQRPSRSQSGAPPSETRTPWEVTFDLSWLVAGAVVGFGLSLTIMVVSTRRGGRMSPDGDQMLH